MPKLIGGVIIFSLLLNSTITYSQVTENKSSITIEKTSSKIVVDGFLNELGWSYADIAHEFTQTFPTDTTKAIAKSVVRIMFDDRFIHIGAILWQPRNSYVVSSMRRDFGRAGTDYFGVVIDPFGDKLNGFHFGVSPVNAQWDALISQGDQLSTEWDNKWYSAVTTTDSTWTVEMAIPFNILRYKKSTLPWGINFTRYLVGSNEISTWGRVPFEFSRNNLAFAQAMYWQTPPPSPGANISVIPFTTLAANESSTQQQPWNVKGDAGVDAKFGVTPSLNLDLTVNPDFSQVEVDQQVTNLNRFELFFPERRQFFLENSDILASLGWADIRPFFSRRIGLASDATTGQNRNIPIRYGARLSGRLNKDWRVAFLNMRTASDEKSNSDAFVYSAAAVQRNVFKRSNITAAFINKQSAQNSSRFNRVAVLEHKFQSANNRWRGNAFYHHEFKDNSVALQSKELPFAYGTFMSYTDIRQYYEAGSGYVSKSYSPEVGFVPRTDYYSHTAFASRTFFPAKTKKRIWNSIIVGTNNVFNTSAIKLLDRQNELYATVVYPSSSSLNFVLRDQAILLTDPFDPTNTNGVKLVAGTSYEFIEGLASYNSNISKKLTYSLQAGYGNYFNGLRHSARASLGYRFQPYGSLTLNANYNKIELPQPFSSAELILLGPRLDLTFSRSIFLSAIAQYNNQIENVNLNMRLQWRYQPASDLFLVYTDNYLPETFRSKDRSIVLKFSYWLNL